VSEVVNGKPTTREIFIQGKRAAFTRGMHIIVRQNFVPRISFHAELEVAVPDVGGNAVSDLRCWHMIIKFLAACDRVSQHREEFGWPLKGSGTVINDSHLIARLRFRWWS